MDDTTRYTGKIIHINKGEDETGKNGGYGFITTPEIPFIRIFFHWSALDPTIKFKELEKGQVVSFQTKEFPDKGLRAIKIRLENTNAAQE